MAVGLRRSTQLGDAAIGRSLVGVTATRHRLPLSGLHPPDHTLLWFNASHHGAKLSHPGGTMRAIRFLLVVFVVGVLGVLAYNYWSGSGLTLQPPAPTATGIDAEKARAKAGELTQRAAETTKAVAQRTGEAVSQAALTAKIKSKMALDDYVKARTINVDTEGSSVTLTGTVQSEQERQRALRLAGETEGVTRVVDKLAVVNR